jgi:hypothetical protein
MCTVLEESSTGGLQKTAVESAKEGGKETKFSVRTIRRILGKHVAQESSFSMYGKTQNAKMYEKQLILMSVSFGT